MNMKVMVIKAETYQSWGVTYCFFIQNILYIKEKEIYSASVSKINSNCENKYFD